MKHPFSRSGTQWWTYLEKSWFKGTNWVVNISDGEMVWAETGEELMYNYITLSKWQLEVREGGFVDIDEKYCG